MTLSIMSPSIITLSIMGLFATRSINDTLHNGLFATLSISDTQTHRLIVNTLHTDSQPNDTQHNSIECCNADCNYSENRIAEFRVFTVMLSAIMPNVIMLSVIVPIFQKVSNLYFIFFPSFHCHQVPGLEPSALGLRVKLSTTVLQLLALVY
jgi:hypothetical protein